MKDKSMTPEEMTQRLREALGDRLESVILYGSAAAGDFVAKRSDYNLLIVAAKLGIEELQALSKPVRAWVKDGNPPPLCFTLERLKNSADVFPLEMLDLKECRRVLHGADYVGPIPVSEAHLRHQIEYELRSRLLQLRHQYLLVAGNARQTLDLLVNSLSSFLVLFRGALRLLRRDVGATKLEAARWLGKELGFSVEAFEQVQLLKSGARSGKDVDAGALFQQYLTAIENVLDKVDQCMRPPGSEPPAPVES